MDSHITCPLLREKYFFWQEAVFFIPFFYSQAHDEGVLRCCGYLKNKCKTRDKMEQRSKANKLNAQALERLDDL